MIYFFFFFFNKTSSDGVGGFFCQAEDGIRDGRVTGVQTWLFRSLAHSELEVATDLDFALCHCRRELLFVMGGGDAVAADDDTVVRNVDGLRIERRAGGSELGEDPAPIRVGAVERALHELA